MGRADAMAPMMALTQSLDLLFVELHVYLILARAAYPAPSRPSLLLYTVAGGVLVGCRLAGRMT